MRKLLLGISIVMACSTQGQQLTFNSQYMLNAFLLNPAAAGTQEYMPITGAFRQQWAGFNDAPATQTLACHSRIGETMGVGGIIYNDRTGPLQNIGFQGAYSYHLEINDDSKLAFGLALSLTQHVLRADQFVLNNVNDVTLTGTQKSFNPDATFGMHYFSDNYWVGISIPQLIENKYRFGDQIEEMNRQVRHYYLNGGYRFEAGTMFEVEPSILLKYAAASPFQFDINTRLIYKKNLWLGLSYRNAESLVAMFGMKRDQFVIGYSYDYTLSNIRNYSVGSHELFLEFQLPNKKVEAASL